VITPEPSYGFLIPLVATIFAIAALLIGLALGAVAGRCGRSLIVWLLAAYGAGFLAHVVDGFRPLEVLVVMSIAFVTGPLGYFAGRRRRRRG
jgi:hypothetical protein